ncbi:MAG: ribosome small subunit-dependent GTPase A [Peptoniphilaceae bacterium]|nr:ribosome small subunit-dependent GTPase A [Peptoniphilaceae bacterium]
MIGKIIKAQKEIYYVANNNRVYLSKARGVFRKKGLKPLVGDKVEVDIIDEDKAYITNILPRKNEIKRPNIANVDQLLVFVTINDPPLNLFNLDKYLAMCQYMEMEATIILSKIDKADNHQIDKFVNIYQNLAYKVISLDNYNDFPKEKIIKILQGKTSAVTGASGVGKSTFLNNLVDMEIEIGPISQKLKRGKNTTRHIEIFMIDAQTSVFDTPGFDSFDLDFLEDENDLKYYFREMNGTKCKFNNCNHINEPSCEVKEKVKKGLIAKSRYENYLLLFQQLKERRENRW